MHMSGYARAPGTPHPAPSGASGARDARDTGEAAAAYIRAGWRVVPIPHGQKGPALPDWQKLEIAEADLGACFPAGVESNVGLLLGEPSGGLVDVDLDCEEAEALAADFLPHTGMVHGRPGRERSHWWYRVEGPPEKASDRFTDVDGKALVELRSTGGQTVVPPSLHPSGGCYAWASDGPPAEVPLSRLLCSVKRLAAATLLARHWPDEGGRQDAAMALGGALGRAGWEEDEVAEFVGAVAVAANDEESDDRVDVARRSVSKTADQKKVTGWPTLAKAVGEAVVKRVKGWLDRREEGEEGVKDEEERAPRVKESACLVQSAEAAGAELFLDPQGTAYAALHVQGHRETYAVGSEDFRRWLSRQAYVAGRPIPTNAALDEAVRALEGNARFGGYQREVFLRVGEAGGKVYLDLGSPDWSAVEVDEAGWRVAPCPPVYFRRTSGMLPLPVPVRGGDLADLNRCVNVGSDDNWQLLIGWLLGALRPKGPYPVLVLHGEQGSAKSSAARALRSLIDPHSVPLRSAPGDEQNMALAAQNNWVVAWDNLSSLRQWQSDALCRLATAGGFATRRLYSNNEEGQIQVSRPMILNGIAAEMVSRADLIDRSLVVGLPVIPDTERRTEGEVKAELDRHRPYLLGALLDGVSAGLRNLATTEVDRLPRLADFALWVEACGPALSWGRGAFVGLLERSRSQADGDLLSLWAVYCPLCAALSEKPTIETTVGRLLHYLRSNREPGEGWDPDFPHSPRKLSAELRRYTPSLRRAGIEVEWGCRGPTGRSVRLTRAAKP
jgi:Bifunctional DNA primase/polymerase, N-terminal